MFILSQINSKEKTIISREVTQTLDKNYKLSLFELRGLLILQGLHHQQLKPIASFMPTPSIQGGSHSILWPADTWFLLLSSFWI